MVSRYEEYLDFNKDVHGRFTAASSLAYQHKFLQKPLVNLWGLELKKIIKTYYPALKYNPPCYQFQPTFDIDHAQAFLNKGYGRQIGAFFRHLKNKDFESLILQIRTNLRLQKDPYSCFEYIQKIHHQYNLKPIYFWLIGDYGRFDKNISPKNKHFQKLIRDHAEMYPVGIHPSYRSNLHQDIVDKEIHRLEKLTKIRTFRSRQHYLKLSLPSSYSRLVNLSIREDYTMGYASMPGFRASIAQAFPWFDLSQNCVQNLEIFPFQLMDVTFNSYLNMSPDTAIKSATKIINATREVGGQFISIWHNSSLCEAWQWKDWRRVYESILLEATDSKNPSQVPTSKF